jgi:hypothetical protein
MKILAWNLNHRAARRRIPCWIAAAIKEQDPDVFVLTEYVEGPDHDSFVASLNDGGLSTHSCSAQPGRQNQVLIASRHSHCRDKLLVPAIHPSVPPNVLEITLRNPVLTILGLRVPAFKSSERALKRSTWNWLLGEADRICSRPALIVGDFNTALADPPARCGDNFPKLIRGGWQHAPPLTGCSWRHPHTGTERQIDHIFLSASLICKSVKYSWDFERLALNGTRGKVGHPDHAMLICEFDQA